MKKVSDFVFPKLDDFHVHLREDVDMMALTISALIPHTRRIMAMLNTVSPIHTIASLNAYARKVEEACVLAGAPVDFEVYLCPKIWSDWPEPTDVQFIYDCAKWRHKGKFVQTVLAYKFFPVVRSAEGTTNSGGGIADYYCPHVRKIMRAIWTTDKVVCHHPEYPGADVEVAERAYFEKIFPMLMVEYTGMKQVFEHLSTAYAINIVENKFNQGFNIRGTLTPHHMLFNYEEVADDPFKLCRPICQEQSDIEAAVWARLSPAFFHGSDTAPHPLEKKLSGGKVYGMFLAPLMKNIVGSLSVGTDPDDRAKLVAFYASRGAAFYGLPADNTPAFAVWDCKGYTPEHKPVNFGKAEVGLPVFNFPLIGTLKKI